MLLGAAEISFTKCLTPVAFFLIFTPTRKSGKRKRDPFLSQVRPVLRSLWNLCRWQHLMPVTSSKARDMLPQ